MGPNDSFRLVPPEIADKFVFYSVVVLTFVAMCITGF